MKKLLLIIVLTSISLHGRYIRTVDIANQLSYPRDFIALRNKVTNHLRRVGASMLLDVEELQQRSLGYRAGGLQDQYVDNWRELSLDFDDIFKRADRIFLLKAREFDEQNAPVAERKAFILEVKNRLTKEINALIQSS